MRHGQIRRAGGGRPCAVVAHSMGGGVEIDAVSGRPTTVVESATSHSPFLSAPGELAATIATVHRARG